MTKRRFPFSFLFLFVFTVLITNALLIVHAKFQLKYLVVLEKKVDLLFFAIFRNGGHLGYQHYPILQF